MRTHAVRLIALAGIVGVTAGCATSQEWATWRQHPTHFASGEHLSFSMRNSETAPHVTRQDIALARDEGWWGKPITVGQERILDR